MSLQWKFMMKRSLLLLVTFIVGIAPTIAQSNKVFHAFYYPYGIVIDSKGSLFVTGKNNKVIKISPSGQVSEFAGSPNGNAGTIDDYGTKASFRDTRGIAIDGQDNLYVCDYNKVRKISPAGLVSTYAGNGNYKQIDGSLATASFNHLHNIATNKNGEMYVTDELFDAVKKEDYHTIRKISKDGSVTTLRNTDGSPIRINYAGGITCDSEGNLIVCDQRSRCIKKITARGNVSTIAGKCDFQKWNPIYKEGSIASALLVEPSGIAMNKTGEIFFADLRMHRIIKVANSRVTTIAGNGEIDFSHSNIGGYAEEGYADGNAKSSLFDGPQGIAFDRDGNLFIVDSNNKCIRKLSNGGVVSTFCK